MAEEADKEQKTEEPSGRKLARARRQGQVAQSREVNTWFMLLAGTGLVMFAAKPIAGLLEGVLLDCIEMQNLMGPGGIDWDAVQNLLGKVAVALVLPMLVTMVAAVAGSMVQTGLLFAAEKFKLDLSRLSPISGFTRMFSMRSVVELLKSIAKVAAVGAIVTWLMLPQLSNLSGMLREPIQYLPDEIYKMILRLLFGVLALVTVLAIADYAYQRFAFMRQMRMTKQEVKDEHKETEGDPKIKGKLRQIRTERARKRMMASVPKASVVITNPTHYAVALQYEMGDAAAPKVVAKGTDLVALRIREIAEEHDVPIVENPPLARALYATVEIDREVPPEHYKAVAEIIGYVFRLKGKMKTQARRGL